MQYYKQKPISQLNEKIFDYNVYIFEILRFEHTITDTNIICCGNIIEQFVTHHTYLHIQKSNCIFVITHFNSILTQSKFCIIFKDSMHGQKSKPDYQNSSYEKSYFELKIILRIYNPFDPKSILKHVTVSLTKIVECL